MREKLMATLEDMQNYDFSLFNIKTIQVGLSQDLKDADKRYYLELESDNTLMIGATH
jgi:hypothetical protein